MTDEEGKPLKVARSQAELIRVRQGKVLIFLASGNVLIAAAIALKTFGFLS